MANALLVKRLSLYSLVVKLSAKEKSSNIAGWLINGIQIALRVTIYSGMYRVALGATNSQYVKAIWAIAFSQIIFGGERPQLSLQIGREIKDGTVSMYLLRPKSYINQSIFSYLGRSIPGYSSIGLFAFSTAFFLTQQIPISPRVIVFSILLLCGGIFVTIIIEAFLGLTGFWTNDTSGVQLMNHKMGLLFGGIIIPFALLPDTISQIVRFTPWSVSLAQPGYVTTHFSYGLFIEMATVLIAWGIFTYLLCVLIYKRGIEKLNIGGG